MAPTRRTTALVLVASVLIVGGVIAASLVWTDTVLLGDDKDSDRHVKEIMFAAALGTTMGVAVVLLICACACAYDIPDP